MNNDIILDIEIQNFNNSISKDHSLINTTLNSLDDLKELMASSAIQAMEECDINSYSVTNRANKFHEIFTNALIGFSENSFDKTKEITDNKTPKDDVKSTIDRRINNVSEVKIVLQGLLASSLHQ